MRLSLTHGEAEVHRMPFKCSRLLLQLQIDAICQDNPQLLLNSRVLPASQQSSADQRNEGCLMERGVSCWGVSFGILKIFWTALRNFEVIALKVQVCVSRQSLVRLTQRRSSDFWVLPYAHVARSGWKPPGGDGFGAAWAGTPWKFSLPLRDWFLKNEPRSNACCSQIHSEMSCVLFSNRKSQQQCTVGWGLRRVHASQSSQDRICLGCSWQSFSAAPTHV